MNFTLVLMVIKSFYQLFIPRHMAHQLISSISSVNNLVIV